MPWTPRSSALAGGPNGSAVSIARPRSAARSFAPQLAMCVGVSQAACGSAQRAIAPPSELAAASWSARSPTRDRPAQRFGGYARGAGLLADRARRRCVASVAELAVRISRRAVRGSCQGLCGLARRAVTVRVSRRLLADACFSGRRDRARPGKYSETLSSLQRLTE